MHRERLAQYPARALVKANLATCSRRVRRCDARQSSRMAVALARSVALLGRKALECPFGFDLFESFPLLVQAERASKSNPERFFVGIEDGKMPLLAEGMHHLHFTCLEFFAELAEGFRGIADPRRERMRFIAAPVLVCGFVRRI